MSPSAVPASDGRSTSMQRDAAAQLSKDDQSPLGRFQQFLGRVRQSRTPPAGAESEPSLAAFAGTGVAARAANAPSLQPKPAPASVPASSLRDLVGARDRMLVGSTPSRLEIRVCLQAGPLAGSE